MGQFGFALKGRGFSRAVSIAKSTAALAAAVPNFLEADPSRSRKASFEKKSGAGGTVSNRHLRDGAPAHCRGYATPAYQTSKCRGTKVLHDSFSVNGGRRLPASGARLPRSKWYSPEAESRKPAYRARASTSVTSSGCSLSPIQLSTARVTIWLISGRGNSRLSRTRSIRRCSPNSPKSFSGSVTPSL